MKNQKFIARMLAGLLAVLMLSGLFMQLFSVMASAAQSSVTIDDMTYTNHETVTNLTSGKTVNVTMSFIDRRETTDHPLKHCKGDEKTISNKSDIKLGSGFRTSSDTTMKVVVTDFVSNESEGYSIAYVMVHLSRVVYNGPPKTLYVRDTVVQFPNAANPYNINVSASIPDIYFNKGGGSGDHDDDDDETFTSDIVIESVFARDKNGAIIREVTKDTSPFTLDIVYTDRGFRAEHIDEFGDDTLFAYITDAGEFIPQGTNRGTLKRIASADGDPPRFRVSFENLKYGGSTANFAKLDFRVQYLVYGENISGTGSARLYAIQSEGDGTDDETAPPTPYIIISQYDLGAEQIEAGSTFTLSLNFANTSSTLGLENIMMVVNPVSTEQQQSFLSIASATNTYYYDSLPAGGALSQNVDILVKASATVGSQAISVDFKYEYLVDKKRESGTTNTTIYIPITQIDRFTVDPITDYSEWMQVGEEGYVTVSFVNRGKSPTYNVSGYLLDSEGNQGQTEHFGNLEPGANGTLDFTIMPQMPGDYEGTIIIRYENENGEDKEIPLTFTAFVEEPWYPGPLDPGMEDPGMMEPQEPSTPWWKYLLFIAGGLAIAVPIALYLAKRVMAKGREEMDEDF
ncbi:MAG: hypothetical protein ACOX0K_11245 [Oscillospiraceae bacterium]